MQLLDRVIALASGATVRKRVFSRYAWERDRSDRLAPQIAQLRRAGYENRLSDLAKVLGLDNEPVLRNADVVAGIRRDSRDVAFGVLSTHNRDLKQHIASVMSAPEPPSQRQLSASLKGWERDRAEFKTAQIGETEHAAGYDQALRDVLDRNNFSLSVHVEPREAQCGRCQELIDAGTVPADDAPELPLHPNCVHRFLPDAKSLRAQAQQRGSVWLGGEDEIELADVAVRALLVRTDAALTRPRRAALLALDARWAQLETAVA